VNVPFHIYFLDTQFGSLRRVKVEKYIIVAGGSIALHYLQLIWFGRDIRLAKYHVKEFRRDGTRREVQVNHPEVSAHVSSLSHTNFHGRSHAFQKCIQLSHRLVEPVVIRMDEEVSVRREHASSLIV
jgi:hypothetical protein